MKGAGAEPTRVVLMSWTALEGAPEPLSPRMIQLTLVGQPFSVTSSLKS